MKNKPQHICPSEIAGVLDNKLRRWIQNPAKLLNPFIRKGMTVVDLGCGPGFFTIEMAKMVTEEGKVIAADVQEKMLDKIRRKITGTSLASIIELHQCESENLGVNTKVDLVLAFYMIHEVPDQNRLFSELKSILKSNGLLLVIEPKFHVNKNEFNKTLIKAREAGFKIVDQPNICLSRAVVFTHA